MKRNVVPKFFLLLVVCLNSAFVRATNETRWVGLDLGQPHVITKIGLVLHQTDGQDPLPPLGIIEGANQEDYMDALPLYIVTQPQVPADVVYFDIHHSKGFRYVRYVPPAGARCEVSELTCYGQPGVGDDTRPYQLTNLPTVCVHTVNDQEPYDKKHQIDCNISILAANHSKIITQTGTIRMRGNGSSEYPKMPYRIKFNEKQQVLDAPAKAKKWTLINNYGDKTLMRNLLAFEISKKMKMPYTPYGTLVDVMVNGEYKGVYQLCDQVQVHKGRVDITEMTPEDNEGEALTGGYLFEIDAYAREEKSWFRSGDGKTVTIHSPDDDVITPSQASYIESYFNTMERAWRQYLDLNTFIRHFLTGELAGSTDTYWSVYLYKERGNDTTYVGPVWDFDLAFENDHRTYPINDKSDFVFRSGGSCASGMKAFVSSIIDDAAVRQQMETVWRDVRHQGLDDQFLIQKADSLKNVLSVAQALNFVRWPILYEQVQKEPVIWGSYDEEVENVKRYIQDRFVWMDEMLHYNTTPDHITDIGIDASQPMEIYSISGVYEGHDLQQVKPGIYIIKQGQIRRKVVKK